MNELKIEIGQYRAINKGALRGYFSLLIQPEGILITDCAHFCKDGGHWFAFPQRERKYDDGRKSEYFPYMKLLNKEYGDALKESVMSALKQIESRGSNEKEAYTRNQDNSNKIHSITQELPF